MRVEHRLACLGVEIYYERAGGGPPVILIQGVGCVGGAWQLQVEDLIHGCETLCFDNRGIGKSVPCNAPITIEAMAEDTCALIRNAGWDSAHVIGHSMGGVIAQQLALDHPERVRSLSLLCTFARAKDAARLTPWVLWMTLRTRIGTRRMRRRAFLEMLVRKQDLQGDLEQLAERFGALIGRDLAESPPILLKQLQAMRRHDAFSALGRLAGIPTLVLSAQHDRIAPPRFGRMLANAIPGAQFDELANASHGVIIQNPGMINSRLRRFLESVENARAARAGRR